MTAVRMLTADLAVIGAGSGGLSVAAGAAQLGLKVVLFEKGEMGGDCLNYGCVPSKALIAAGKAAHAMRTAGRFGVAPREPDVDFSAVKAHLTGVIADIAPVDSQERFEGLGVTVIREHARFLDPRTIASDTVQVRAKRIVVATGSRAFVPPIPGLETTPYLTNETIFDLDAAPAHLIVLGGGPIGVELGQAFARLGSRVTIVEAARALGRAEPEAAAVALGQLRQDGVEVLEGWRAAGATGAPMGVAVALEGPDGATRTLEGSHLLVAVGRRPVLDGLDLEAGRVAFDAKGIHVKPNLRSVSNGRVWAVGDANGKAQFTHAAGWHASVWVRNALFKAPARHDGLPMPAVTYCEPELAQIGLTEAEAKAQFGAGAIRIAHWSYEENDRARTERAYEGFAKLITDKKGKILGATVVGEAAGETIQLVGVAMSNKLPIRALTNFISPYPTRSEIIKRAAGQWYTGTLFSPRTRALVRVLSAIP